MTDDDAQAGERKWTLLIRRSFGVPDIIGDEAAAKAIELVLRERHDLNPMERPEDPSPESVVFDALVDVGNSHGLDEALLSLDGGAEEARIAVNRYVANHTNWTLKDLYRAIEIMTDAAIEFVRSYLNSHPQDAPPE